jgi:glycerol uptake facilitator-like aquaporin
VHIFSDISGGQLNPAVSFGLFFARKLSLYRAALFTIAQIVGGLIGAGKPQLIQQELN